MKYSKYSGITLLESWCVLIEHLDVVALEVLLYNRFVCNQIYFGQELLYCIFG